MKVNPLNIQRLLIVTVRNMNLPNSVINNDEIESLQILIDSME